MGSVLEKVRKIVSEQLDIPEEKITPEARFIEDLGADSLDLVELMMALDEAFDAEIPDEEAEKIRTVQDAINFLESHGQPRV